MLLFIAIIFHTKHSKREKPLLSTIFPATTFLCNCHIRMTSFHAPLWGLKLSDCRNKEETKECVPQNTAIWTIFSGSDPKLNHAIERISKFASSPYKVLLACQGFYTAQAVQSKLWQNLSSFHRPLITQ